MISDSYDKKLVSDSLEKILDEIRLIVIGVKIDGTIFYANSHFLRLTNYTENEIIGKNWFDTIIPVNKIDTVIQKLSAIVENKFNMMSENPIVRKDGTQLTVEWHNFPILKDNKVVGTISIGIDVTARNEIEFLLRLNEKTMRERADMYEKQNKALEETKLGMLNLLDDSRKLEEELQAQKKNVEHLVEERTKELNQEKARLLASINSFPSGFVVTDNEKNVLITNDKVSEIFGIRKIDWFLSDISEILDNAVPFMDNFERVMADRLPVLLNDIDLGRKFLEIYMAPIFLSPLSNETIGNIILITDVTEEKIIERSKDEFFSIASHELRTPLTAIRGNSELVKKYFSEKLKDTSFNEMIEDIRSSSERLISLVNEFLNMSRLEQGKLKFERESLDIRGIIQNVVDELKTNANTKGLEIKFEAPKNEFPSVKADKNRVREVVVNLIGNAISYTEKGFIDVSLSIFDRLMKISVSDTGKGIPLQNQNLLFRKFQQANVNIYTRDSSKSTGLGLYISKLMVEEMGGTIYLEKSDVGKGSTFVFTLTLA